MRRGTGANRKVGNLINMLPAAAARRAGDRRLATCTCAPDYLTRLVAALEQPGVGLVTTLYAGLPAARPLVAPMLGATQITHGFLPGALLARAMGRQDCLGATMALRRDTLARIGGFAALVDHLADDNVLGRLVQRRRAGGRPGRHGAVDTVPETALAALFAPRTALGADDPRPGAGAVRRLGAAVSARSGRCSLPCCPSGSGLARWAPGGRAVALASSVQ